MLFSRFILFEWFANVQNFGLSAVDRRRKFLAIFARRRIINRKNSILQWFQINKKILKIDPLKKAIFLKNHFLNYLCFPKFCAQDGIFNNKKLLKNTLYPQTKLRRVTLFWDSHAKLWRTILVFKIILISQ